MTHIGVIRKWHIRIMCHYSHQVVYIKTPNNLQIILINNRDNHGEGNGNPLNYSCLENPMDGGASWAAVHGVTESLTRLSDFTFAFHLGNSNPLQCSFLENPRDREPGGLLSMRSHRVGHNWSDLAAAAAEVTKFKINMQKSVSLIHNFYNKLEIIVLKVKPN